MPEPANSPPAEFEPLDPGGLDAVAIVAQALDNQWVPPDLLVRMLQEGLSLEDPAVRKQREVMVRTEYLRALVNASQVVVNRAYLYNNPAVFRDYLSPGADREAFQALLAAGAIVPYLYSEQSPTEPPAFPTDPRARPAWEQVVREVAPKCVRLSWNEESNALLAREKLARRFHEFVANFLNRDPDIYMQHLRLPDTARDAFRARLADVARFCIEVRESTQRHVVRDQVYGKFVTVDATKSHEGKYDAAKPFAGELKQLFDLAYNVNLPDALGGYALTPQGSLSRVTLQEEMALHQAAEVTADDLLTWLRRTTFALAQDGTYLASFDQLSLLDVVEVRKFDEWASYVAAIRELMDDPMSFPIPDRGAARVHARYLALAKRITGLTAKRAHERRVATWKPRAELLLDIAGAVVSVVWAPAGVLWKVAGKVSQLAARRSAPVVTTLAIRGLTRDRSEADLSTSVDFMRRRMTDATEQWERLVAGLQELPGFTEVTAASPPRRLANMSYPEPYLA